MTHGKCSPVGTLTVATPSAGAQVPSVVSAPTHTPVGVPWASATLMIRPLPQHLLALLTRAAEQYSELAIAADGTSATTMTSAASAHGMSTSFLMIVTSLLLLQY